VVITDVDLGDLVAIGDGQAYEGGVATPVA